MNSTKSFPLRDDSDETRSLLKLSRSFRLPIHNAKIEKKVEEFDRVKSVIGKDEVDTILSKTEMDKQQKKKKRNNFLCSFQNGQYTYNNC